MDECLMTQRELAQKYNENPATISWAMKRWDVKRAGYTNDKHPNNLYKEDEAVRALIKTYQERQKNFEQKALYWKTKAIIAEVKYEEA